MKITLKRAVLMLAAAFILSAGAILISKPEPKPSVQIVSSVQTQDPIEKFRTERQQLRAMQKAQLNDIAHDADAQAETAELARRQLIEICAAEEQELTIEGILAARGFQDPVATVHNGSVNILIRTETLTRQESSVILDLVCRETGATSGDIKIIPIN